MNIFLDAQRRLRNGWWILIFFIAMAAMLIPLVIVMWRDNGTVPIPAQLAIVAVATAICQLLRRRPITEVAGRFDRQWPLQFLGGLAIGAALMLLPAALLFALGMRWTWTGAQVLAAVPMVLAVAATEELLFRGFMFQRLIDGVGAWLAQTIIGAYFVLTHAGTLADAGATRPLAIINIFVASLLFGLAYLRTRSLAMPLGIHFAANLTQGTILGFGVSGHAESSVLVPQRGGISDWLTGGNFGLEGSVPGLIVLVTVWTLMQWRWRVRQVCWSA